MSSQRARVAVIGTGWWATATHIPAILEDPNADLVALCDASPERLAAAANAYSVENAYAHHQEMLEREKPDAVIVATTHATHFAIAQDCLLAGAHTLVEKPLTLKAEDARVLVDTAKRQKRALIPGYPWNASPYAQAARERLLSGEFGAIQHINAVFNSYNTDLLSGKDRSHNPSEYRVHGPGAVYSDKGRSGGGHGHLQMTHLVGLLCFVTGLRVHSVRALMANHGLPLDLVNVCLAEFEGGALGTLSGTSNAFLYKAALHIGCEAGSVDLDVAEPRLVLRHAEGERETMPHYDHSAISRAPAHNLVAVANQEAEPLSSAEVGWFAVEILDAAYRSAEAAGRPVAAKELYAESIAPLSAP